MARFPGAVWRPLAVNFERGGLRPRMIVLHVMQGSLVGTDAWFRNPRSEVSAHFGLGKAGTVYQWVDTDDIAWHAAAANPFSIGVECEGDSGEQLTRQQLRAAADITAWAARQYGIPLALCDDPSGSGLAWHGLGGAAWGNHPDCPGAPIVAQRPAILTAAEGGQHVSANGPEHWDGADWEALRRQMQRGVLAHVGNAYVTGLSAEEAADVEAAHEGLTALVSAAATGAAPASADAIAAAVVAKLPPAAAGGLNATQVQTAVETGLASFFGAAVAAEPAAPHAGAAPADAPSAGGSPAPAESAPAAAE